MPVSNPPTPAQIAQARSDYDLASRVEIPVQVLRAIRGVESGGDPAAIRFETRLFANKTGRTITGTSRSAFNQAFAINKLAAVQSTSFGKYQVLAKYFPALYGSPEAGVAAFDRDPVAVGDNLFVAWMNDPAHASAKRAAQRVDFYQFAHFYNGCSDCSTYATRLHAFYDQAVADWNILARYIGPFSSAPR